MGSRVIVEILTGVVIPGRVTRAVSRVCELTRSEPGLSMFRAPRGDGFPRDSVVIDLLFFQAL